MKAEHRKELHTNALADGMGRLVQRFKTPRQKGSGWIWLLAILTIVVVVTILFIRNSRINQASELWVKVDNLDLTYLKEIVGSYPNTNPGYAVRFEKAYLDLWHQGIAHLGNDNVGARESIQKAKAEYLGLAGEVKGSSPILAAEALYNGAVAEEALSIADPEALDRALAAYKTVVEDYPLSARGKDAAKRVEALGKEDGRRQIREFYTRLNQEIKSREPANFQQRQREFLEQHLKQFKDLKPKK